MEGQVRKNFDYERAQAVTGLIRAEFRKVGCLLDEQPMLGIVLGSGLGDFVTRLGYVFTVPFHNIGFPQPGVQGHAGELHYARIGAQRLLIMQGRPHLYGGHDMEDVVLPIRALTMCGARTHIITCASGSISPTIKPGTIVSIKDHLNMTFSSPLRGYNEDRAGVRFPDMTEAYDRELRATAKRAAQTLDFNLHEYVYAMMPGPQYETPAEIRMLRTLGADLVGMSTVPEVIAARHMGARVLALSCVSNLAAGVSDTPLSHEEVMTATAGAADKFAALLIAIIKALPEPA